MSRVPLEEDSVPRKHTTALPDVEIVDHLPLDVLPAFLNRLSALTARAALRWHDAARDRGDDCEAFDVVEAARRLRVSTDTLRANGEAWGLARVLTTDKHGKPTRVVYPRALLAAFLGTRPPRDGR